VAPHVHFWRDRPYEDGIVIETCGCGAVRFGISDWGASDMNHPDFAVKELLTRAEELNRTHGKEGHEMPTKPIELPEGFTPRPAIQEGATLNDRNKLVGKWHDENKELISLLFHTSGYPGLRKIGISDATSKGLFKRWQKADQKAAEKAHKEMSEELAAPPAVQVPTRWPGFEAMENAEQRMKWLQLTVDLATAGKLVLQ
jgi:hypothetical protein